MEQATVTTNRRLERGNGPLAGVAAGMADYFGIDPTIVRLGLVATTVLGGPTVPVVYLAAWLIIPAAEAPAAAPVDPAAPWATTPAPQPPVPAPAPAPTPPVSAPAPTPPVDAAAVQVTDTSNDDTTGTVTDTLVDDTAETVGTAETTDEDSER